jgi:hypothetical protein
MTVAGSFFTDDDIRRINERQAALEAEAAKLRAQIEPLQTQLFNVEDALRRLTQHRHQLVYGKRDSAA